ncbi:universal stress protein family protein [Blastococcus saxobsidens]|uniref:Universal stress protein family protein n=1 Tax=Blastococcus saxobsidens TaxID=138336 RepID=A0A4Q7YD40_9ACTN|nr:universal stress protein [Blastococcus saxobsidens]RZU34145.1 universal stress protein family protein [Blastococcus saxobsidens]
MFSNVLIALKEDLDREPLIELAKRAAAPDARLHLLTLIKVAANEDGVRRLKSAEQALEGRADTLRAEGYDASFEVGIVVVAAAMDIARIAEERGVDLMVIGLAKRSRVGKALVGSDAQRVLLGATCPVLVTHLYER